MDALQRRHVSGWVSAVRSLIDRTVRRGEDGFGAGYDAPAGALAEWLGTGLQNLVQRFDSATRLSRLSRSSPVSPGESLGEFELVGHEGSLAAREDPPARRRAESVVDPLVHLIRLG